MPVGDPRLGSAGRLLINVDDNTSGAPSLVAFDGSNHTSASWLENKRVTDEDNNFEPTRIDSTDREAARQGFETEVSVSIKGEISFTMFNVEGDPMVSFFQDAGINRTFIPAWSADGDPTDAAISSTNPVQGLLANFSVSVRPSKPVKGLQTLAVTMTAATKPINYKITSALSAGAVV